MASPVASPQAQRLGVDHQNVNWTRERVEFEIHVKNPTLALAHRNDSYATHKVVPTLTTGASGHSESAAAHNVCPFTHPQPDS